MNTDVSYKCRLARSFRLLSGSRLFSRQPDSVQGILRRNRNGGMSTIEAIALIQAINSGANNRQAYGPPLSDGYAGGPYSGVRNGAAGGGGALSRVRQLVQETTGRQQAVQQAQNRQIPVPVPVPAPFPSAVVAAFVAALVAAIAAGFPPIIAIAKAVVAALVALIIIIIQNKPMKSKASPLVKKIVIKKTVFPFIFPITVKKKEKEIIYKYIKPKDHEHHEHKEEHHEETQHYSKYKHKKIDLSPIEPEDRELKPELGTNDYAPQPEESEPLNLPPPPAAQSSKASHLESIESLVDEQDKLQTIADSIINRQQFSEDN